MRPIPRRGAGRFRFRKGARFTYAYDMGDFWRHEIRVEDGLEPSAGQFHPVCTGGAHGCPPEDCGGPAGYAERRLEAAGFDALEDLATLADWVQDVVLDGKTDPLADAERLGDLEDVPDRMKARQPYLADEFSRRAVNARFRKGEHRDLMHQQFYRDSGDPTRRPRPADPGPPRSRARDPGRRAP